jgi:hypothetical protein
MSTDSTSQMQPLDELTAADDDGSLSSSGRETAAPRSGLLHHISKDLFKFPGLPDLSPNSASRRHYHYQDDFFSQKHQEQVLKQRSKIVFAFCRYIKR